MNKKLESTTNNIYIKNNLYYEVVEDLKTQETYEEAKSYLEDLQKHGCVSGMVSKLIYYKDTIDFYNRNQKDIENLINEYKEELGYNKRSEFIASLNGKADDLEEEQNLLSWFAYEEIARQIYEEYFEKVEK